jgi:hypothetical protein
VEVFSGALRVVWLIGIAFAGIGFLLVFVEKEIEPRNELNTEFGMEEREKHDGLPVESEMISSWLPVGPWLDVHLENVESCF